jgi:Spy/CpxP family protein refolding chaperone
MRTTSILFVALALGACDSAEPTTNPQPDEIASADDDEESEAAPDALARGHHGRHGKGWHGPPSDRLCEKLDCTDQQRTQIDALFERPDRRERPDDSAARQALAAAFRGDAMSTADVEAYVNATRPATDRAAEHVEKLAALHGILTAEQRATLADEIEEHGFFGGGRGGRHGKWADKKGDGAGAAKHIERKVEKLCEPLACSDDQEQKIAAIVGQAKADRPEVDRDAHHAAVAAAMRAESFDTAAVKKELEAGKAKHDERHAARAEVAVAIHDVLTAEQRAKVADRIAEHGPEALLGHGKHGKHAKHGKRGPK